MKCYNCKKEIPDGSKACPRCGSQQEFTRELIGRAIEHDQMAVTQLYNMTKDNVYFTIKTMIANEDLVLDLTQDTFLKAMKNLGQLKEPAAFRGWIKKIARNMAIDVLRKKKVISFSQMVSADSEEMVEFEDDRLENLPEVVIDRKETTRLIGEILNTLSPEQRVVTELFYYECFSIKEIAEELGVSENTVKSRLKYARNKIEIGVKELEKKGTKLYSLTPMPFLLLLFRSQDAYAAELPDAAILQAIQSGTAPVGAKGGQPADSGTESQAGAESSGTESQAGAESAGAESQAGAESSGTESQAGAESAGAGEPVDAEAVETGQKGLESAGTEGETDSESTGIEGEADPGSTGIEGEADPESAGTEKEADLESAGTEGEAGSGSNGANGTDSKTAKIGAKAMSKGIVTKVLVGLIAAAVIGGIIAGILAGRRERQAEEMGAPAEVAEEAVAEPEEAMTEPEEAMTEPEETEEPEQADSEEGEPADMRPEDAEGIGEEPEAEEENSEESRMAAYQVILDEYIAAANLTMDEGDGSFAQLYGEQFPNVDPVIMGYYLGSANNIWKLCYAYYDIDGNGAEELLVGVDNGIDVSVIDLYTFDGSQAVKAVTYEAAQFTIYSSGMIWEYRMTGEETESGADYIFKEIADDGYTMDVQHEYISYYDARANANLSFKDHEPITWEEFQDVVNQANTSEAKVKDFDWQPLAGADGGSDLTGFLGVYAKDYGDYDYTLTLSVSEDGKLSYSVGNDLHGGWMADVYTDYAVDGSRLSANKIVIGANGEEIGTDTFTLNEDGSITAVFSDIDFNSGVYQKK